jgi:sec-independent protein translocase protein TatA
MFGIGMPEALVILVIVVVIFGVGKLPEIGNVLGRTISSFKKATSETDEIEAPPAVEKKPDEKKP